MIKNSSDFFVSTEQKMLDVALIHRFLSQESMWARNIPLETVQRSIDHSLCFGGYVNDDQVAFARVISDYATFANLVDVFVMPDFRGRGFSKVLVESVVSHPKLQGLRRFTLATADAHGLYEKFGFAAPSKPAFLMEKYFPAIYDHGPV